MALAALQEALSDDAGLLDDPLFLGVDDQANELRHAPRQRRRASRSCAKHEIRSRWLRAVPHLLGNHASGVSEMQHRFEIWYWVVASGNLIFAALARKNRPKPANA